MKLSEFLATIRTFRKRGQPHVYKPHQAARRPFYRPLFELLEDRIAPATVTWINSAGGDWDTTSNWSGGVLPGATDAVVINSLNAGAAITHLQNTTDTVNSITAAAPITLSGGTLNVAGTFSDSSLVTLAGGTLANATVQAGTTLSAGSTASTLSGVTLAGTLNLSGGAGATIINGLTLGNGVVGLANQTSLAFAGTQTLGGTGDVEFTDNVYNGTLLDVTTTNSVLTVGAGITLEALPGSGAATALGTIAAQGTGSSIVLGGTVSAAASGATIVIDGGGAGGTWTNNGMITSVSGGTLELGQPATPNTWSNSGTISATGSTVELGGTFTTAGLGTFNCSGGTVELTGTLNNTGATLALNNTSTGSWQLDNGTINGGTITTANGAVLSDSTAAGGTLSGVTLAGTLDLFEGRSATIINGLTLANGLVELSNSDSLEFAGTQLVGGTGDVEFTDNVFNGTLLDVTTTNSVLTVGAGVTLEALQNSGSTTALGTIAAQGTGSSIVLGGTVSAAASGATIVIDGGGAGGTWTNNGMITSVSGGTLELGQPATPNTWSNSGTIAATGSTVDLGGTFTTASLATFSDSGGTVDLTGTLNNTGATLALNNSSTGTWLLDNGTINGGTITTANGAVLGDYSSASSILSGVTLAGTLQYAGGMVTITNGLTLGSGLVELASDAGLNFSGTQMLTGTGTVVFSDGSEPAIAVAGTGNVLTIGPNILIHGNSGQISAGAGSFINDGAISADTGAGEFTLNGNFSNAGAITASNGSTIVLGPIAGRGSAGTFTNSGTITGVTGTILISETLNNASSTLALTAATGSYYLGTILGGTIAGGTISTTGGAALIPEGGGTLNGVILAGTLNLASPSFPGANVTITGGLTLNQGSINLFGGRSLIFKGTQNLGGTGTLSLSNFFVDTPGSGLLVPNAGDILTILPGVIVQGTTGTISPDVAPLIGSSGAGQITNQGTIEAAAGGALTVQGFTNFAGGTLTGGTWEAIGGGALRLVSAAITTNAASILLDGAASQIDTGSAGTTSALAGFSANAAAGSFTIQNGASITTSALFTNAGTLTINSGATFIPGGAGVYTQTGGTTILSAGTLGAAGNQISIQGGTLTGAGAVNGNLVNAGEVDLGSSSGTLTIQGNYSQTSAGALALKVGGATAGSLFDQVNISGTASLNGTLNAMLTNGFAPGIEESFDVLNFASSSGSFATFNPTLINGSAAFVTNSAPTSLSLVGATAAPDLAASNVMFTPAHPLLNQNVTVTYTDTNLGTVPTTAGSWTDSIYLSTQPVVDANAVLLGRVTHTGDLPGLGQYTGSLTAPVPGLVVGSYRVLVVVDSGLVVPDVNRANNTGVAATELSAQPPTLTIGTPLRGTIANGQDLYYQLNVTPGTNVKLDATFAAAVESELYLSFGALPTANSADQSTTNLNDLTPELVLPSAQGGVYYIWLHGREGAGAGQPFTLLASLMTFAASAFTPASAGNQGQVTMDVTGSGFTAQTTVTLQGGGAPINAQTVTLISANELNATFDLTSVPIGNYNVQATNSGQSSTAPGSFQVTAQAVPSQLWTISVDGVSRSFSTNPPPPGKYPPPPPPPLLEGESANAAGGGGGEGAAAVGPAGPFTVSVIVQNQGTNDTDVPSFEIIVTNVLGSGVYVQPAQTLAPGQAESLIAEPIPNPLKPGTSCNVSVQQLPAQTTLSWASQELGNKPASMQLAAWTAILDNFVASVGSSVGTLDAALQADAIYLAQVGDPVTDENDLIDFEMEKANDAAPVPSLTSAVDDSFVEPGLPLTFERSFQQPIGYRYQLGPLGYGWTSNWNIAATTDQYGNVLVQQGALTSEFLLDTTNGSYQSASGNTQEILTLANGSYTLTGLDGSVTAFLPNGQLNYVQDSSGNRITAGYTSGLLTSVTQTNGDQLIIHYNAQGLISETTDPAGNTTMYAYDANDQLISVASAQGTYQYTYVNGQGIAQEHALASITYPDGTHTYYSYDGQGRLIKQSQDNGANAVTYAYLSPGGYTETDANGAVTKVLTDLTGQPAIVTDPLGNVSRVTYNANGQPQLISYPGGSATSNQYDAHGNVISQTDPLGNTSQFSTNPQTAELQTFQNANGATTSFAYTSQEELASITQPDGTASQYFYNSQGQVSHSIDALGRSTYYTYDNHGRMIRRADADGTITSYGYDLNGNLTSVTDASGTITMSYDAANDLTKIVYPNGQFLTYTYNAGEQLTQMVDQTGFTENYAYNNLGQLVQVTDANDNLIVSYSYDLGGRLVGEVHGNGTYTTYTYDADGDLLGLVNFAPNGSINSSFIYTYDALGDVTSMTTASGTTTYGYDADGQLISVALPTGETITYQYDAMGNRTVVSDNGVTTGYTSNNMNEYTSVGSATYSYDADGNLTITAGAGGDTTYTYDDENRLIAVKTPTDVYTYQYDALGNLVASTDNGQPTQYLVDPLGIGNVVAEYNGSGSLIAHFTFGLGLVSQVSASGTAEFYDYDATGSTAGLSGNAGSYQASYSYLPFGQVQTMTGTAANPFQYNGKLGVMTVGAGLDYMRLRFYSPANGRFVNADPTGLQGGTNLYMFASNNPLSFGDPTGSIRRPYQEPGTRPVYYPDFPPLAPPSPAPAPPVYTPPPAPEWIDDGILPGGKKKNPNYKPPQKLEQLEELGIVVGVVGLILLAPEVVAATATVGLILFLSESNASAATVGLNGSYAVVGPSDPNSIYGPGGVGSQGFVPIDQMPYVITFDNEATATAPAQIVTVTQQLDPNLDWSTFQLDDFGFGGQVFPVPAGLTSYSTRIDATSTVGVYVDVDADFNPLTGLLTWTFTSIDPTTLDVPVGNVEEGYLPPDATPPEGEGFISYVVLPKASDPTGTIINAKATVIFQAGLPGQSSLATPSILNTIDAVGPTSSVTALAAHSPASFTVNWAGQDDAGGSGIAGFNVYDSDNGGPFTLWQAETTQTSATFNGQAGHTYGFYSVATDNVGNQQATPVAAQTITKAVTPTPVIANLSSTSVTAGGTVTFTVQAEDGNGNPVPGYVGTVQLTSTDKNALYNSVSLPATYTFVPSDNGSHTFTVTLRTDGSRTITVTDQANSSLTATTNPVSVNGAGAFSKFALSIVGGNTVVAGNAFLVTAQPTDPFGNPVSSYNGPSSITATASPPDPQVNFSVNAPVNSSGSAFFLGTLDTVGSYTITAGGGSTNVTVAPASPDYFTVAAPSSATMGVAFNVTVKAWDRFGNPASGYAGTVSLTSSDPAASVLAATYTFTAADAGVHNFPVTLNSGTLASGMGTTIFVRDTTATTPPMSGFSPAITVQGLVVPAGGFQPTATGFIVTFSKPFTPLDLTEYGPKLTTVADATLVGGTSGNIPGTLYLDPTTPNTLVFKASSASLLALNAGDGFGPGASGDVSAALPDDTYTVTLVSGAGSNGFVDALGNHLDGQDNGGTANYTTTFTTTYQDDTHNNAHPTPILAIPDFARGPDSSTTITVPGNKTAPGIPVTLYNVTNSVTDATFTLTYDPQIFTPTAGGAGDAPAGSTFTMGAITSIDSTHSSVAFIYHDATGHTGTIVLGDILATVPNSAAGIYKTKELLALSNISITGGATVLPADGMHVDAYLGDVHVTAAPAIDASDATDASKVASGAWTGFSAYTLLDPAIIGGFVTGHVISVDAADVTSLFTNAAHGSVPQLPSIPALITTVSVGGADPTVSVGAGVQTGNGIVSVPVLLDDPDPVGSTGMTEAHLALTYDPSVLRVSPADITLGSIPGLGTGWQITSTVDAATGQIAINLINLARTPITSTQAGSLVNIAFHVLPGAAVPEAAVQLVNQVTVNGQRTLTEVDDDQGPLSLSPGPDRVVVSTGVEPMATAASQLAGQVFQIGTARALNSLLYGNSPGRLAADGLFLALGRVTGAVGDSNSLELSPLHTHAVDKLFGCLAGDMDDFGVFGEPAVICLQEKDTPTS